MCPVASDSSAGTARRHIQILHMTPEITFQCLLVSRDPAVLSTVDPILRDFSICSDVCPEPSDVLDVLGQVTTDLLVVDLESEKSTELVSRVYDSCLRQKPTILAVSKTERAMRGVDVILRKPVTHESGVKSLKAAYFQMLQDYRKHTRCALMTSVQGMDENNQILPLIVTNIGDGGVGLATKAQLGIGNILSIQIPLPGLGHEIDVRARVLWTRDGTAGCEFIHVSQFDQQLLRAWLESRYRIKKPLISI